MEELSVYRSRIGLFNGVVCRKTSSHRNIPRIPKPATRKTELKNKCHKTTDDNVNYNNGGQQQNCYPRIFLFLVCVSAVCWIELCGPMFEFSSATDRVSKSWNDNTLNSYHIHFVGHKYGENDRHNNIADTATATDKYPTQIHTQTELNDEPLSAEKNYVGLQTGICAAVSEPNQSTWMCVCRTCSYLIGNKGTHISNGNPRSHGAEGDPGKYAIYISIKIYCGHGTRGNPSKYYIFTCKVLYTVHIGNG